jgi:ribosome maturation factor RimP
MAAGAAGLPAELEAQLAARLEAAGFELVLAEYLPAGSRSLLRLRIDRPGGVTVEDCARMSEYLGAWLEVIDPFPGPYRLEVSSPGVNRPLVRRDDFERFAGQTARITFQEASGQKKTVVGVLQGLQEDQVQILTAEGLYRIAFPAIRKARIQYRWADEELG